ncbi:MAG TPA: hypothetical protein VF444_20645 [Pseudonocardiaceae bacterium]
MSALTSGSLLRADLAYGAEHVLVPSDTFDAEHVIAGEYPATRAGLTRFVDDLARAVVRRGPVHLYLIPAGHRIELPELPAANLHFDLDPEQGVAAASLAVQDRDGEIHQWMTVGTAGRDDVLLTQDAWNADVKRFPSAAFITVAQLRDVVLQWAFGDILPPPAVPWRAASEREVGWL